MYVHWLHFLGGSICTWTYTVEYQWRGCIFQAVLMNSPNEFLYSGILHLPGRDRIGQELSRVWTRCRPILEIFGRALGQLERRGMCRATLEIGGKTPEDAPVLARAGPHMWSAVRKRLSKPPPHNFWHQQAHKLIGYLVISDYLKQIWSAGRWLLILFMLKEVWCCPVSFDICKFGLI